MLYLFQLEIRRSLTQRNRFMSIEIGNWPLVVDLDGTLIRTNSLDETFFDTVRRDPLAVWKVPD